ncbi:MAG: hypothetical protein JWR80_5048 [Bradyrhizobium sp.]|nr:hypothetical protein [Bradyrhizobium sp.]
MLLLQGDDRLQIPGGTPHPVGERRTIDLHTLARHDLRLPVKRKMVGIFLYQHIGEQRLARKTTRHDVLRRPCLRDPVATRTAAHLRPHRHQHAVLRGHDVEPLGPVPTDPVQRTTAPWAGADVRRDLDLMAHKMSRQRRPRLVGRAPFRARAPGNLNPFPTLLLEEVDLAHRDVGILERQQQLIRHHLLRPLAEVHAIEDIQKMLQPGGAKSLGDDYRLQRTDVVGEVVCGPVHDMISAYCAACATDFRQDDSCVRPTVPSPAGPLSAREHATSRALR